MDAANTLAGLDARQAFLSYSRGDLKFVRALAAALRSVGVKTWLDVEDITPGTTWQSAIATAMLRSELFISCVSRLSLESHWTAFETERALDLGLSIVPLLLDPVRPEELPAALRERQFIDVSQVLWPQSVLVAASMISAAIGATPTALPLEFAQSRSRGVRVGLFGSSVGTSPPCRDRGKMNLQFTFSPSSLEEFVSIRELVERSERVFIEIGEARHVQLAAMLLGALVSWRVSGAIQLSSQVFSSDLQTLCDTLGVPLQFNLCDTALEDHRA